MVAAFANAIATTLWSWTHSFDGACPVHKNGLHHQSRIIGSLTFILLLPVVDRAFQQLEQGGGGMLRMMLQQSQGFFDVHAPDLIGQQTHPARRCARRAEGQDDLLARYGRAACRYALSRRLRGAVEGGAVGVEEEAELGAVH